ncbi:MAG: DUF1801 domain-containing protein [Cyclobacteriaceae bacterium]|nr:DUF1801 domain-containing protein [Cyclobacteriaceae bacterium]
MNTEIKTIDDYITEFADPVQKLLRQMHSVIKEEAPEATEAISYAMPTFKLNGNLVHFAGYKSHIGFYPAPSGILAFEKELTGFKTSKGAIQFPLDNPLPVELIRKIVRFRVKENREKAKKKK